MRREIQPGVLLAAFVVPALASTAPRALAWMHPTGPATSSASESEQGRIERALSAAPPEVAEGATVAETDARGNVKILRAGTNGFTCTPGDPGGVGKPAMCQDAASRQWDDDLSHHRAKPTNTVPGITYMLAGATQRSDSDPYDTTSKPIAIGPHWMIMWPFDPKATGLPDRHKPTGAYIMWAGTPYAHLHVMGRP